MAVTLPSFGWIQDDDGVRTLVIIIKKTSTGRGRGRRWIKDRNRWSALASFTDVEYTSDDIGEHFSGGSDWRSYQGDAVLNGVMPTAGMVLVNHRLRRCYGEVLSVKDTGAVVWQGPWKKVETEAATLHRPGYGYADQPPPGYARNTKDGWV